MKAINQIKDFFTNLFTTRQTPAPVDKGPKGSKGVTAAEGFRSLKRVFNDMHTLAWEDFKKALSVGQFNKMQHNRDAAAGFYCSRPLSSAEVKALPKGFTVCLQFPGDSLYKKVAQQGGLVHKQNKAKA